MGWEIDFSEDTMRVLRPKFGDPALVTRHSDKPSRCSHSHVVLTRDSKMVYCRSCGKQVDPYDVLLTLSRDWGWSTRFSQERKDAESRVAELTRDEARLKARIKRARSKFSDERISVILDGYISRLNEASDRNGLNRAREWFVRNGLTAADSARKVAAETAAASRIAKLEEQ